MRFIAAVGLVLLAASVAECNHDFQDDSDNNYDEIEEPSDVKPKLISKSLDLKVKAGEVIRLPCEGENFEHLIVMWKRDGALLAVGTSITANDDRVSVDKNVTFLTITNASVTDAGHYVCMIAVEPVINLTHRVTVFGAPIILYSSTTIDAEKDNPAVLICNASGYPTPRITWTRKGKKHFQPKEGKEIIIERVSRMDSGEYECQADNGIGQPAVVTFQLRVHYAPEIDAQETTVHKSTGDNVQLTCLVHGEPKPKVYWTKDQKLLDQHKYSTGHEGRSYFVTIKNIQPPDFGIYSCHANNTYGSTLRAIDVSGAPKRPVITTANPGNDMKSYFLAWTVQSLNAVTNFELGYRKFQSNPDWKMMRVEKVMVDDTTYNGSIVLTELSPGTEYEATVRAQNAYGWSVTSEIHKFYTNGRDYQSAEAAPERGMAEAEANSAKPQSDGAESNLRGPSASAVILVCSLSLFFL